MGTTSANSTAAAPISLWKDFTVCRPKGSVVRRSLRNTAAPTARDQPVLGRLGQDTDLSAQSREEVAELASECS